MVTTKTISKKKSDDDDFDPTKPENFGRRPRGGGMPRPQIIPQRDGAAEHLALPAHVQAMANAGISLDAHRTHYGDRSTLDGVRHISFEDRSREEVIPVHVKALAHAAFAETMHPSE